MKSNEYHVKVIFAGQVLRVDTVWADTESMATLIAHKNAVSELETQMETEKETARRLWEKELDGLQNELWRMEDQEHDWPEYMDETENDVQARKNNHNRMQQLRFLIGELWANQPPE